MDLTATPRGRRALFALLYLAEGAPIGFLWWALPTLLREAGQDVQRITALTALIALPWTLKLLGGPLVDLARGSGWPLRRMLVVAQLAMFVTLLPLAREGALDDLDALTTLLLLHAIFAALQDVLADALCLAVTPPEERGRVNGWMQAGMLVGRGAFGGGALLLAASFGHAAPPLCLAGVVLVVLVLVWVAVPTGAGAAPVAQPFAELRSALGAVLRLRVTWRALAFALLAAAGFEAAGAVAGPFLVDHGYSSASIARAFELPKVLAMAAGALLGGRLCDRWGPSRATLRFQAATAACVLAVAGLEFAGLGGSVVTLAVLWLLYLSIGLFTAASYTLLMDLTAPRLAATQFSAYMGATNGCEAWSTLVVGRLLPGWGYGGALAALALVSLLALPLVPRGIGPGSGPRRHGSG